MIIRGHVDCPLCNRSGLKSIYGLIYHLSRTHHLDSEQRKELITKHFGKDALPQSYSYTRTLTSRRAKLERQLQPLNERNANIFFMDEIRAFAEGGPHCVSRADMRALKRHGFVHKVKDGGLHLALTDKAIELLEAV